LNCGISRIIAGAFVLVILVLLVAGCMSIPGPGDTAKTPTVTDTPVTQVQVQTTLHRAVKTVPTTKPVIVTTQTTGYENASCASQGGYIVSPGEKCPAAYLPATDSYSCCSTIPVAAGSGNTIPANATIVITPFDISLNLDDNPGSITP
jgi:hypothetical protein